MYHLNLVQGEQSEHIAVLGDGKSGKTSFVRDHIIKKLPDRYKTWCYDYNHNGFNGVGTPVRSLDVLIDGNMQYLPQVKDKEECNKFLKAALKLGGRVVVLDEFHNQQNSKSIPPDTALFLRTARHAPGGISWIVIAQSPLEMNDAIYHNADHIFAFFMDTASRHIDWYYKWFGKRKTATLIHAHAIAV
ncbi:MAG: hypothetical protein AB1753_06930, partial [Thermoproteota archaeon]